MPGRGRETVRPLAHNGVVPKYLKGTGNGATESLEPGHSSLQMSARQLDMGSCDAPLGGQTNASTQEMMLRGHVLGTRGPPSWGWGLGCCAHKDGPPDLRALSPAQLFSSPLLRREDSRAHAEIGVQLRGRRSLPGAPGFPWQQASWGRAHTAVHRSPAELRFVKAAG